MAINKEKSTQRLLTMPKTLAQKVADFRHRNRISSESEALRRLIQKGLEAEKAALEAK